MMIIKVRRKKDGLFAGSKGNTWRPPSWGKSGQSWTNMKHVASFIKCHVGMGHFKPSEVEIAGFELVNENLVKDGIDNLLKKRK